MTVDEIKPEAFKKLNDDFINTTYNNNVKTYKDFLITTIDRSLFDLPTIFLMRKEYGIPEDDVFKDFTEIANVSSMYDLDNGYVLTDNITYRNIDDNRHAIEQLEYIKDYINLNKTVTLYDKRYNATAIMLKSMQVNSYYLIRLKKNVFKRKRNQLMTNDGYITINLNGTLCKKIKDEQTRKYAEARDDMKIRIVNFKLPNGEMETLATNIFDPELTIEDFKEIFKKRWSLNSDEDKLKFLIEFDKFSGRTKAIIQEDFYSFTFLYNLANKVKRESDIENTKNLEYSTDYYELFVLLKNELNKLKTCKESEKNKIIEKISTYLKNDLKR